jgi:hypothetical protein
MATYTSKPSVYGANGDGSFTYRWNIREIQVQTPDENGDLPEPEPNTGWECSEVIVWATVTRAKLVSAVLASIWDSEYESKLVNDFNAANAGIFGKKTEDEAKKYIDRYVTFLKERKDLKEQVNADCDAFNII